ncbi:hypothetical protein [Streptomyces sp. NPDC090036]|uniref:hypothetical protein n=1 Tax=Streptomyces sp. NPDC090036 TaxID=3365926 RepID=UPI0037F17EDB
MHGEDVAAQPGVAAVLPGQRREEVDVVGGVPYGDPPAGLFVAVLGDPGGVHHGGGDLRPPVVEEDRVVGVVADRDVPHVLRRPYAAQRFDGSVQEQRQVRARDAFRGAGRARQVRVPRRDEVGVGVLVALAGTEEVVQELGGRRPARSLLRQRNAGELARVVERFHPIREVLLRIRTANPFLRSRDH